ncbi:Thiamine-monophosphate kinase [Salisediminibacterium beveridgei]|uniref:Thiamine-monophosphate kinase n=1 Tax=Salisediminibacterium beveridgei TaxID=632773 RepID=A0A1D7QYP1_9BACI|nr:Thiamine-monophosphate kinase [Salisediminibacterium beveridgei]
MDQEFEWIESIKQKRKTGESVIVGVGDDAAIVSGVAGFYDVIAVDTMVEDIHFSSVTMTPEDIGYKALAVNISDLAAMGAIPRHYIVSIAIPKKGWPQEKTRRIYEGLEEAAEKDGMDLIGGDTVSTSDKLVITVTVTGIVETSVRLTRDQAEPGDVIVVTGPLGSSPAGLDLLLGQDDMTAIPETEQEALVKAHQRPVPQVKAGRLFAEMGIRAALNDISDGIAREAKEIAEASSVRMVLDWNRIPKPDVLTGFPMSKQQDWVLYGGEEFQLVAAFSREHWREVCLRAQTAGVSIFPVGMVEQGDAAVDLICEGKRETLTRSGYAHF